MTRRRRQSANPFALFVLLAVVVALFLVVRLLPWLIAAAVIAVIGRYIANRQTARPRPAAPPAEHPEVTRLRAQVDQLQAELADARLARDAAWDAAASRPPRTRPAADTDEVTRLVDTPLSGVRRLGE